MLNLVKSLLGFTGLLGSFKKTTTAKPKGKSVDKRLNEQNNGCAMSL